MKAVFWGVRGSTPAPGSETAKTGGNTSCVELRLSDGGVVILDAGTGIRKLGQKLLDEKKPIKATLFFSHFHWDHIQGFPFFRPAFVPGTELLLLGGQATTKRMRQVLEGQMDSDYFPVSFDYLQADLKFHALNEMDMDVGSAKVSFIDTNHTSRCLAARFDEGGRKLIYMTDNELESDKPTRFDEFVEFCGDAEALIHDAQYTHETYKGHVGWGHSSVENVVKLAVESGVKNLYLFHHDPDSTDAIVSRILRDSRESAGKARLRVHAAKEGAEIVI